MQEQEHYDVVYIRITKMWANAQRDGRGPAEYKWRPPFNAAKFG